MPGPKSWDGAKKRLKRPRTEGAARAIAQDVGKIVCGGKAARRSDGADRPADADEDGIPDVLRGVDGAPGRDGAAGAVGSPGEPGVDGATITEASINDAGELVLGTSDGRILNAGNARGQEGTPGVGVETVEIDADGDLIVVMTNGDRVNAGRARGLDGRDGRDAEGDSPLTDLFNERPRTQGEGADILRAFDSGVDIPLIIDYNGVITDISVSVNVTHPDINKLRLTLIAPDTTPYVLFNGANVPSAADLVATFPGDAEPAEPIGALVGAPARGRWVLRAVDFDQANLNAVRRVNSWGLNITRRADNAWRLPTNLVVDGAVDAQTLCRIQQLVQNGQPVPGAITLTCGNQDPVRLTTFQCGNGQIDPAETCDDGNFDAGDGCDPRCLLECGNGRLDDGEACDDGNLAPNDDCTDACQQARCGDNIIWLGNEGCDNGDANSDEPGAECRTDCTNRRCGDGVIDPGEECDDANDSEVDECANDCRRIVCGNRRVDPGEECDDGNDTQTDECTNACRDAVCGDEIVGPGEACDGGPLCGEDCEAAGYSMNSNGTRMAIVEVTQPTVVSTIQDYNAVCAGYGLRAYGTSSESGSCQNVGNFPIRVAQCNMGNFNNSGYDYLFERAVPGIDRVYWLAVTTQGNPGLGLEWNAVGPCGAGTQVGACGSGGVNEGSRGMRHSKNPIYGANYDLKNVNLNVGDYVACAIE